VSYFKLFITFFFLLLSGSHSTPVYAEKLISEPEVRSSECHLNFGLADWRPLQYIDEKGQAQGFQVGLVRAIAAELGCSLTFIVGDWKEIVAGLKEGAIDFVPDATKTPEREVFANFSIPYRKDSFAIYVRKKDVQSYTNQDIDDLKKAQFRLAINRDFLYGYEIEAWQSDNNFNSSIIYSDNTEQNFGKLLSGEIDGFVEDPYVMAYLFRSAKVKKSMTTLPLLIKSHHSCFMFSKKRISSEFIQRFNLALNKVKKKPEYRISWFDL
jgi:polar amino acid transport system substrate-binding protein